MEKTKFTIDEKVMIQKGNGLYETTINQVRIDIYKHRTLISYFTQAENYFVPESCLQKIN